MTRLKEEDVTGIAGSMPRFDVELKNKLRYGLQAVACHACNVEEQVFEREVANRRAAVIPFTCGSGIIERFGNAVRAVISYLGMSAFVTNETDASGMAEGVENGADILFLADEKRFIALDLKRGGRIIDNIPTTAKGFVAALELACGGFNGAKTAVLGAGPVGTAAAYEILRRGGQPVIHDVNEARAKHLAADIKRTMKHSVEIALSTADALTGATLAVDATNKGNVLQPEHLKHLQWLAAPGMPLGVGEEGLKIIKNRLIHDPLQTGVAVMAVEAVMGPNP